MPQRRVKRLVTIPLVLAFLISLLPFASPAALANGTEMIITGWLTVICPLAAPRQSNSMC